jgi:hypothetical protein
MRCLSLLIILLSANRIFAEFSAALLQNNSYWSDGKAEYNIYDAQIVRDGVLRSGEVLHILVREAFDPKQFVKLDAPSRDAVAVLKLNQIVHIPAGLALYQQMHSTYWRVDSGQLLKCSLTSNDGFGNTFKQIRRSGDELTYEYNTSWNGMAEGRENINAGPNSYFYDEMPFVVRLLDFSKPTEKLDIQLAGSIINPKRDSLMFKPAKISFKLAPKTIEVSLEHSAGTDHFILDRDGPHLLREWSAADGSHLKMKRNLKVDYWNYTKPGDRERALQNPMLRQPD